MFFAARFWSYFACSLAISVVPALALAQDPSSSDSAGRFELPTVIVTAEKTPEDALKVPVSVTSVSHETLGNAGIRYVKEASLLAPNVYVHEFSARKLSNPRIRGVGNSPNNPGVTTFIDGVPQLNANSSSMELLDVDQIEFIRGPRSALFGRNTVGGLINITSRVPSRTNWTGDFVAPLGNFAARDFRGSVSGPLVTDRLSIGIAAGHAAREGFTVNDVTGNTLDDRSAAFGKAQLLWTPSAAWDVRAIVTGERARDGDYSLHDLAALRQNPFHASRDYEGFTNRDVVAPTFLVTRRGTAVDIASTTGIVRWETRDRTDLDYSARPLIVRHNSEEAVQFTQEVRIASAAAAPAHMGSAAFRWQLGLSMFTQDYEQDAVNNFAPFLLSPVLGFPVSQHSPHSVLDDSGVGIYGQGTWTFSETFDLSAGARFARESKNADLRTFYDPAISAPAQVVAEEDFSHVSPQVSAAFRVAPQVTLYGTVAEGFKAGGFNPASPAGRESYGEENSWNYEGGIKGAFLDRRLSLSAAVFRIDWHDIQLTLPNPAVPAQFFVGNGGEARSTGVELELAARPHAGIDIFGSLGVTHARFKDGSTSGGRDVGGNELPNTPPFTANAGAQVSHDLTSVASLYVRGDVTVYGTRFYDETNAMSQATYSLTNFRAGLRGAHLFGEGWVQNAFDTRYIPLAFAYGSLAPSGFMGEPGAPRTFGVRMGVGF